MLLCKNRRLFAVSGDNSHVLTPIPMHLIPIPIPWLILLPFPWESHRTHGIPVFPIPMHTSTRNLSKSYSSRRHLPSRGDFAGVIVRKSWWRSVVAASTWAYTRGGIVTWVVNLWLIPFLDLRYRVYYVTVKVWNQSFREALKFAVISWSRCFTRWYHEITKFARHFA